MFPAFVFMASFLRRTLVRHNILHHKNILQNRAFVPLCAHYISGVFPVWCTKQPVWCTKQIE
jgi:hypothetical protein